MKTADKIFGSSCLNVFSFGLVTSVSVSEDDGGFKLQLITDNDHGNVLCYKSRGEAKTREPVQWTLLSGQTTGGWCVAMFSSVAPWLLATLYFSPCLLSPHHQMNNNAVLETWAVNLCQFNCRECPKDILLLHGFWTREYWNHFRDTRAGDTFMKWLASSKIACALCKNHSENKNTN